MRDTDVNPTLHPGKDFSSHAPVDRHQGRFNAMFLDSHVEAVTLETHHNDGYFIRRPEG